MSQLKSIMGAGFSGPAAQAIHGNYAAVTAAGTGQSDAALLSSSFVNVTAAGSADGVVLPTTTQGSQVTDYFVVGNVGATTAKVYPGGSDTANGSTSAVSVAQNKVAMFFRISSTAWLYFITA